jgi:hypothetical protein
LINLVQGTVSFIAAQVAKTGTMRVETPTAVLGIRGTFITLSVSSVDGHTVASLGLESHPVTGEQFSGAFTLTNRITGNQTLVNQINSIFSVSPVGAMSESPKPAEIHALEQATFQALVPVMHAAANFGAQTGQAQGQNPNPNPAQDGQGGQNANPGPSPGGSSGPNPAPTNQSPTDSPQTLPSAGPPALTGTPPPAGPTTTPNTQAIPPVTPTPANTPTGTVTDVVKTEAVTLPDGQGGSTSQDVAANNAPTITSPDPHIQLTETATTGSPALQSKSASLTFTDPDLNDSYTVSLLGVSASGVIAGLPDAATLLMFLHTTGVTKAAAS